MFHLARCHGDPQNPQHHLNLSFQALKVMAEEAEVEKYKRFYEEQKARVKELERQNSQLKDAIQQLMSVGRQQGGAAATAATAVTTPTANHSDIHSSSNRGSTSPSAVVVSGGGGGGNPRAARAKPAHNPPAPQQGTAGRTGARGNGTASGAPGSSQRGGGQSISGGGRGQGPAPGTAAAAAAVAAAAAGLTAARAAAKAAEPPPVPDVRTDIVAMMREASMSKDKQKLEHAIKKAEDAGLHFEAKQGRRQLGRISA